MLILFPSTTDRLDPVLLSNSIYALWRAVDQIHQGPLLEPLLLNPTRLTSFRSPSAASQNLQTTLINLDYAPIACGADGCNDLHLRFITRLDRDTMVRDPSSLFEAHLQLTSSLNFSLQDITLLIHALIKERKLGGALGASLFLESEKRVRNALKLMSFYSELYITSRDPHMYVTSVSCAHPS
jgi:hypothetical protein